MAKMKLVVLDEDSYFIEMCSSYVRTSDYAEVFNLTAFSNKEQGFAFIEKTTEPYILLVHEGLMPLPERVFLQQHGCLILLSNTSAALDILEYPVLCKFQPLNQLLSHIVSHYNEYSSNRMLIGNRTSKIISVYSAVGGSGKTLAAVHLSRELVYQGRKVFYLNLEQLPSLSWMEVGEEGQENHLARMLYYGKTDPKLQMARVERYKRKHRVMGYDYFPGGIEPKEVADMSEKDTETLIQSILSSGAYDFVILDLDSALYPRIKAGLKQSDLVVWIVLDEVIHLEKMKLQLQQLKLEGPGPMRSVQEAAVQFQLVVNKFNGTLVNSASLWPWPIAGYLPYIPEWKAFGSVEAIQQRGVFSESLAALPWVNSDESGVETNRNG